MKPLRYPHPTHRRMWRLSRLMYRNPWLSDVHTIGTAAHRALLENV